MSYNGLMSNTPNEKVKEFFSRFPERQVPKGELLIWADNEPEFVFYILEGRVRQYDIFENGRSITVNTFGIGAYFPMTWAINRNKNRYFFEAVEDSLVSCAPPDKIVNLLESSPGIAFDLLGRVFSGSEGILQKMTYMMLNNAQKRIVFELVTECKRIKKGNTKNLVKLNEVELAMHTGLARETVNRQLAKLKKEEIVTVTKEGIVINNLPALESKL
jgi:CRP/FNR family transcriptional regulator, cyclic AMP receptor protein